MNHTKCLECGSLSSLSNIFVFTVRGPNSFCMVYTLSRSWFFFLGLFYMLYYNADKMDDLNLRHLIKSSTLNLFLHLPEAFILRHLFMLYACIWILSWIEPCNYIIHCWLYLDLQTCIDAVICIILHELHAPLEAA